MHARLVVALDGVRVQLQAWLPLTQGDDSFAVTES